MDLDRPQAEDVTFSCDNCTLQDVTGVDRLQAEVLTPDRLPASADTDELIERIGQLVDRVENHLTMQMNHLMPTAMRADAARSGLADMRRDLIAVYSDMGGEYDADSPVSKSFDNA